MTDLRYLKDNVSVFVVMPSGSRPRVELERGEQVMVIRDLAHGRVECMTLAGPCVLNVNELSRLPTTGVYRRR